MKNNIFDFDTLPKSAKIGIRSLMGITDKSRATIYRWIDQGILPKPHKFGNTHNYWNVGEIRQALNMQGGMQQ